MLMLYVDMPRFFQALFVAVPPKRLDMIVWSFHMDGPICMMNDLGFEMMIESDVGLIHFFQECASGIWYGKNVLNLTTIF